MLPNEQIVGKTNGGLTIVSLLRKEHGRRIWSCQCECGNTVEMTHNLFSKRKSCGCRSNKGIISASTKHGMSNSTEWSIWHGIKKRCLCKTDRVYHRYGGRGVGICKEWAESFQKFYEDMGPRPHGKTIDRIDNNLGYSKENCRWVDWKTQQRNRRSNHLITFNGETKCLIEWAEQFGIRKDTLRRRLCVYKWPLEEALKTPTQKRTSHG